MTTSDGIVIILTLAAYAILLLVVARRWSELRVDLLRRRLFVLRDELFDYALAGNVAFDAPSYRFLRRRINGLLRFADKTSLLRVLAIKLFGDKALARQSIEHIVHEWMAAVAQLPTASQARLREFYAKAFEHAVDHMALGALGLLRRALSKRQTPIKVVQVRRVLVMAAKTDMGVRKPSSVRAVAV